MSSISQVIATINRMEEAGVIKRYAIGGAVAATFYLEPVLRSMLIYSCCSSRKPVSGC